MYIWTDAPLGWAELNIFPAERLLKQKQDTRSNKLSTLIDASRCWKLLIRLRLVVRADVYTRPNQVHVQGLFNFSFGPFKGKESSLWSFGWAGVCSEVNPEVDGLDFAPVFNLANQISGTMQSFLVVGLFFSEETLSSVYESIVVSSVFVCVYTVPCPSHVFTFKLT